MTQQNIIEPEQAGAILRGDGIVAIPTETVYGLAARCTSETAIKAVFAQKQRPATNPLIIHVASYDSVSEWAETSSTSEALASHFWPGPLTLVLPSTGAVAPSVTAGQSTVAVRMPDHPIALQIIKAAGEPLAAPSANISGKPSPTTVEHVIADHGDTIPVVDGGPCRRGLESTVVRVEDGRVTLLRPGTITREEIEEVLGVEVGDPQEEDAGRSPGTQHPHYAPVAIVRLFTSMPSLESALDDGKKQMVMSAEKPQTPAEWTLLRGSELYSGLRKADELHMDEILVLCDDAVLRNEALYNRLQRAAEPRNGTTTSI